MRSVTVNISFNDELLKELDKLAKDELRSRSELIREAARAYIDRKRKWSTIFSMGNLIAKSGGINDADIEKEIAAYRNDNAKK